MTNNVFNCGAGILDLDECKTHELEDLIKTAQAMVKKRQSEESEILRLQVIKMAELRGVSVEDLLGLKGAAKRAYGTKTTSKVPPKYRDNLGNTWSGRGQQPVWLRNAQTNGLTLESFRIA